MQKAEAITILEFLKVISPLNESTRAIHDAIDIAVQCIQESQVKELMRSKDDDEFIEYSE